MSKTLIRMGKGERGITGLETAIILIAFVVVASVFAYTVLSAGLFSSQKADETVHSGISQCQATMELRGSVLAFKGTESTSGIDGVAKIGITVGNALVDGRAIDLTPPYFVDTSNQSLVSPVLSDCDSAWTAGSNVTVSIDSADYREPPRSNKLTVATAGANLLAYDTFSRTVNMSAINQMSIWLKSSEARSANDMKVRLASSTTNTTTGAQYQEMNVPALATNTWKKCILTIAAPTSLTQVRSIGIYGNNGTATDNTVVRVDEARMVYTDGSPVTLISYSDSHGVIDECAWTVEFSGGYEDDGDSLLEDAEKATITVWLFDYNGSTGVYTKGTDANDPFIDDSADFLGANDMFSLQVMPSVGSTLLLEKRIPAYLNDVMRLN